MKFLPTVSRKVRWKKAFTNIGILVYLALWTYAIFNGNSRAIYDISPKVTNQLFFKGYCPIDMDKLGKYSISTALKKNYPPGNHHVSHF